MEVLLKALISLGMNKYFNIKRGENYNEKCNRFFT